MGEVGAFQVPGFKCYFPASDHYPQHFEVYRRGEYVVRIFFVRTCRKRGLNWEYKLQMRGAFEPADQALFFEQVMRHKRRLLREWNTKVCPDRRN